MTDDGRQPTGTQAPRPEETVFQQPTPGFAADDAPGISASYEANPSPEEMQAYQEQQQSQPQAEPQPTPQQRQEVPIQATNTQTEPQNEPVRKQSEAQPQQNQQPQQSSDQQPADQYYDYSGYFPDALRPQPEELLYAWSAPSRPFKKHNRNYFTTIAVIVLLVSLILVFAGQFVPMAVVCAVAFMIYVINTIPPQEIQYSITTYGVRIGDKLYYWDLMTRFWYGEKYGKKLLYIQIIEFPERLTLVLGDANTEILTSIFSELLLLEKPPLSVYERIAQWLQDKFPLDLDS